MIDQPAYVKLLLQKYLEGTAAPVELGRLMAAWDIYDDDELAAMIAEVTGDGIINQTENGEGDVPAEHVPELHQAVKNPVRHWLKKGSRFDRLFTISSFLLLAASVIWFFLKPGARSYERSCKGIPGTMELPTAPYHCKLMLSNGSHLSIDSTLQGLVTQDGDLTITQPEAGLLVYQHKAAVNKGNSEPIYHTIITPPGQQYKVILPDGSQLRLNAASSIRFPVTFSKNKRIVHLVGEALFEVVPGNTVPFYIYTGNTEINVAEGRLNVHAYTRKTSATILAGSFEIKSGSQSARLIAGKKPMLVSNANRAGNQLIPTAVDTLTAVSWQKAIRVYENVSMRDFAADIGRWYNLEMVNVSCIPVTARLSVDICYNAPLDQVFSIFTDSKLKFYQVGNKITFCDPSLKPSAPAPAVPFKYSP